MTITSCVINVLQRAAKSDSCFWDLKAICKLNARHNHAASQRLSCLL